MKILLRGLYLVLKYEGDEWSQVEFKLKALGMEKKRSSRIFGIKEGEFYRLNSSYEDDIIRRTVVPYGDYDDINAAVYNDGSYGDNRVNCCIFRIVPDVNMEVSVQLPKYLTIVDIKRIANTWSRVYKTLLEILTEAEIDIKFKKNEEVK